jgi:hypothetical protein
MCSRGEDCTFAHGEAELRPAPDFFKTKPCPNLLQRGVCEDPTCTFAHNKTELRTLVKVCGKRGWPPKPSAQSVPSGAVDNIAMSPQQQSKAPVAASPAAWLNQAHQTIPTLSGKKDVSPSSDFGGSTHFVTKSGYDGSDGARSSAAGDEPGGYDGAGPWASQPAWHWAACHPPPAHAAQSSQASVSSPKLPTDATQAKVKNKFHKTKMCNYFLSGLCNKKRSRCSFAHSQQELRPLPDLECTKMCPKLLEGEICTDAECKFAHEASELRDNKESQDDCTSPTPALLEELCAFQLPTKAPDQFAHLFQKSEDELSFEQELWLRQRTEGTVPTVDELQFEEDLWLRQRTEGTVSSVDEFQFEEDLWLRQRTEDPEQFAVSKMRVKNTFITIVEEEEEQVEQYPRALRRTQSEPSLSHAVGAGGPESACASVPLSQHDLQTDGAASLIAGA